jgi:hypothetical protein
MCSKKKKITSINIKRREERRFLYISISYGDLRLRPFSFFGEKNEMKFAYVKGVSLANSINATTRE